MLKVPSYCTFQEYFNHVRNDQFLVVIMTSFWFGLKGHHRLISTMVSHNKLASYLLSKYLCFMPRYLNIRVRKKNVKYHTNLVPPCLINGSCELWWELRDLFVGQPKLIILLNEWCVVVSHLNLLVLYTLPYFLLLFYVVCSSFVVFQFMFKLMHSTFVIKRFFCWFDHCANLMVNVSVVVLVHGWL